MGGFEGAKSALIGGNWAENERDFRTYRAINN
jgi:hypothetical protein